MGGADPQCVACGTSSRMKCIWLNDAEFSFLRYQPWQCLRCAVNHSFEGAGGRQPGCTAQPLHLVHASHPAQGQLHRAPMQDAVLSRRSAAACTCSSQSSNVAEHAVLEC
ncbi:hypothetical protein MTO96_001195 [Rhipicephalus appendiculatus]